MKKLSLLITALLSLIIPLTASAYDFEVDGIYYNYLSQEDLTCEVTSGDYDNDNIESHFRYDIVIPSTVTYNEKTYSVTKIGSRAFYYWHKLGSVVIGNSVETIGDGAFSGCWYLRSVVIGNSVKTIGDVAFEGCSSLYDVVIGNSVETIGDGAFAGCIMRFIEIPNSVTSIGNGAFYYCVGLASVEIPNSVTEIGESAFDGCESLTSIEIPSSVTKIRERTFADCTSLVSVEIPNSVTEIGNYAFNNCTSLTSVEIPDSVTQIGKYAFDGCTSLQKVTCWAILSPGLDYNAFDRIPSDAILYVPASALDDYQADYSWSKFFSEILPIGDSSSNMAVAIDDELRICPLPMRDVVTITVGGKEIKRVTINAINGATTRSIDNAGTEAQIDVQSLSPGIYIVNVTTPDGTLHKKVRKAE